MRLCILKHSMGEDVVKMRRNAFANVSHLPVHAVRTIRSANWQEYVRSIQNCLISLSLSLSSLSTLYCCIIGALIRHGISRSVHHGRYVEVLIRMGIGG